MEIIQYKKIRWELIDNDILQKWTESVDLEYEKLINEHDAFVPDMPKEKFLILKILKKIDLFNFGWLEPGAPNTDAAHVEKGTDYNEKPSDIYLEGLDTDLREFYGSIKDRKEILSESKESFDKMEKYKQRIFIRHIDSINRYIETKLITDTSG